MGRLKLVSGLSLFLLIASWFSAPGFAQTDASQKLSPTLQALLMRPPAVRQGLARSLFGHSSEHFVPVFIRGSIDQQALAAMGVQVLAQIGSLTTAYVPWTKLEQVAAMPAVEALHATSILYPLNDVSVPLSGATVVRDSLGFTGRGVVVGIIDTGIDWKHGDFQDSTGATRIKALLDFSVPGDTTGDGRLDGDGPFGGTLYTESDINAALTGTATVLTTDPVGHGTHAAGSAAGNGLGSHQAVTPGTYAGVAPEADLVIVKALREDQFFFSSVDVANALAFVDSVATALGQPYVANLSLGGHEGSHDGHAPLEDIIDQLTGPGIPGRVITVAAGNEGNRPIHASGRFSADTQSLTYLFTIPVYTPQSGNDNDLFWLDIWYAPEVPDVQTVSISVTLQETITQTTINMLVGAPQQTDVGHLFLGRQNHPDRNLINLMVQISDADSSKPPQPGSNWEMTLETTSPGPIDLWIANNTVNGRFDLDSADFSRLIGIPATAFNAITVGSYVSKNRWTNASDETLTVAAQVGKISRFSSVGPTRDGRTKPELVAPGEVIASALSETTVPGSPPSIFKPTQVLPDQSHVISQGTSFAAPHVTGAVALLLEQDPTRDASQVRDTLTASARHDDFTTLPVPNNTWGYGKLDLSNAFGFGPVAVTLTDFSATVSEARVTLVWDVAVGLEEAGFNLYRSQRADGTDRQRLNQVLITGSPPYQYIDQIPVQGLVYYWLELIDRLGSSQWGPPLPVTVSRDLPAGFALQQNQPNPFNSGTTIRYLVAGQTPVFTRLVIYNLRGQVVRTLVDERQNPGHYTVYWDTTNDAGQPVAAGLCLYRLKSGPFTATRKMLLLR